MRQRGKMRRVGPKNWADSRPLIGISTQNAGPTCEFWANLVSFRVAADLCRRKREAELLERTHAHLRGLEDEWVSSRADNSRVFGRVPWDPFAPSGPRAPSLRTRESALETLMGPREAPEFGLRDLWLSGSDHPRRRGARRLCEEKSACARRSPQKGEIHRVEPKFAR